jgi:hypothetical protein
MFFHAICFSISVESAYGLRNSAGVTTRLRVPPIKIVPTYDTALFELTLSLDNTKAYQKIRP